MPVATSFVQVLRRPLESAQYAAETYRQLLTGHGLAGSMGRKGNPYDNAKAESFMKTLKLEAVCPMALETFEEVAEHLPHFIDQVYNKRRLPFGAGVSQLATVRGSTHPADGQNRSLISVHPKGRTPIRGQFWKPFDTPRSAAGARSSFGGDRDIAAALFTSSIDIVRTEALAEAGFTHIFFAVHPEGPPRQ